MRKIAARARAPPTSTCSACPARTTWTSRRWRSSYRELSLQLHPDRFAQADAQERRLSLEQTTALNEAYKTLKDPVRRAFYLLKLHGVDLDREDAGRAEGHARWSSSRR